MLSSSKHVSNINRALKNIKSEILADFVCTDHCRLIITTNKVASQSDLSAIENYIKNVNTVNLEDIMSSYLFQSKSYFKIINIPYFMENTNISINSSVIKSIIKSMHISNDILLIFKL